MKNTFKNVDQFFFSHKMFIKKKCIHDILLSLGKTISTGN